MARSSAVVASLLFLAGSSLLAGTTRVSSIERFGIGGFLQPIGIHHGFHIERIAPDSAAEKDRLLPHDVIVKVDGDVIRSLDHLRAVLAEAYLNDAEVAITYTRGTSLTHHVITSQIKLDRPKAVARKKRAVEEVEDRR